MDVIIVGAGPAGLTVGRRPGRGAAIVSSPSTAIQGRHATARGAVGA